MPPVTNREYRIPAELSGTVDNVGPQLQALIDDPTKIPDGTRIIFPVNGKIRADAGINFKTRKNLIEDWEGCALWTPNDLLIGFTLTDCVVTNPIMVRAPTPTRAGLYTADLSTAAMLPSFYQQSWYARGAGLPGGTRAGRIDSHHIGISGPKAFTAGTALTVTFISQTDRGRTLLWHDNCDHGAVNNYKALGPNEAGGRSDAAWDVLLEAQHGLVFSGCVDMQIVNPDISLVWGDCIATMRGSTGRLNSFIDIIGGNLHNNGRSGITPKGITDSTIQNVTQREIRRNAMDIEPNDPKDTCRRLKISGGSWKNYRFAWLSGTAYGGVAADVGDISVDKIELGTIHTAITPGPTVRWGPFTFTQLWATAPSGIQNGHAISFDRCDKPIVAGCKMVLQAGRNMRGVRTTHCTDPAVFWNDWHDGVGEWTNIP